MTCASHFLWHLWKVSVQSLCLTRHGLTGVQAWRGHMAASGPRASGFPSLGLTAPSTSSGGGDLGLNESIQRQSSKPCPAQSRHTCPLAIRAKVLGPRNPLPGAQPLCQVPAAPGAHACRLPPHRQPFPPTWLLPDGPRIPRRCSLPPCASPSHLLPHPGSVYPGSAKQL